MTPAVLNVPDHHSDQYRRWWLDRDKNEFQPRRRSPLWCLDRAVEIGEPWRYRFPHQGITLSEGHRHCLILGLKLDIAAWLNGIKLCERWMQGIRATSFWAPYDGSLCMHWFENRWALFAIPLSASVTWCFICSYTSTSLFCQKSIVVAMGVGKSFYLLICSPDCVIACMYFHWFLYDYCNHSSSTSLKSFRSAWWF